MPRSAGDPEDASSPDESAAFALHKEGPRGDPRAPPFAGFAVLARLHLRPHKDRDHDAADKIEGELGGSFSMHMRSNCICLTPRGEGLNPHWRPGSKKSRHGFQDRYARYRKHLHGDGPGFARFHYFKHGRAVSWRRARKRAARRAEDAARAMLACDEDGGDLLAAAAALWKSGAASRP